MRLVLRTLRPLRALCALAVCLVTAAAPDAGSSAAPRGATRTLRVMSYNIHTGIGTDKKLDLRRLAEAITRERPDLVGLQEVDRGVERTGRVDQIEELARLTGMHYAFAPNLAYQGGWYGVAILSRFPILSTEHARYRHLREAERRGYLRVAVSVGGRAVSFVTTHLDYQHDDNRLYETRQLLEALPRTDSPLIVAGDFNEEPGGASYQLMLSRFADAWSAGGAEGNGLTYPADQPRKRIDYIFHAPREGTRARLARVVESLASDHRALVAEIELRID
jgi:endonuclease/exonuclease/phosphatase family metal-dependent hydrolase